MYVTEVTVQLASCLAALSLLNTLRVLTRKRDHVAGGRGSFRPPCPSAPATRGHDGRCVPAKETGRMAGLWQN